MKRLTEHGYIAAARPIWQVVGAHQARVVIEAMGQHSVDGVLAQVPRGRAVAASLVFAQAGDGIVSPHQIGFLLFARLGCGWKMCPAVVSDLIPAGDDRFALARPALDS